jgi:hypothetical protein
MKIDVKYTRFIVWNVKQCPAIPLNEYFAAERKDKMVIM